MPIVLEKSKEIKEYKEIKGSDLSPERKFELISSLPEDAKEEIIAAEMGFDILPPTFQEFIEDPYYLGENEGKDLYPFWREHGAKLFPNRFFIDGQIFYSNASPGAGKSVAGNLFLCYLFTRICCHGHFFEFNKLSRDVTPASFFFFSNNLDKAERQLVRPFKNMLSHIPFLKEMEKQNGLPFGSTIGIKGASEPNHALGECIVAAQLSELGSAKSQGHAAELFNKVMARISGRINNSKNVFTLVVVDSQIEKNSEAICENILFNSSWRDKTFFVNAPIWKVKPWEFISGKTFYCYAGDNLRTPFVLNEGEKPEDLEDLTIDKDKIIEAPIELKSEALSDIYLFIAEKAAIRVNSSNVFFPDRQTVISKFDLENIFDDIYTFDFYDKTSYFNIFKDRLLSVLPEDRKVFVRLDLGLTKDMCGVSIGYCDSGHYIDGKNGKVFKCDYYLPFCIGIRAKSGQENNIISICDFIITLSKFREIGFVSTDTYQSRAIKQTMLEAGLECDFLSMDDKRQDYYTLYKNLLLQGSVHLPKNSQLLSEHLALQREDGKVDHPKSSMPYVKFFSNGEAKATGDSIYSGKDISDAVSGNVVIMYNLGEKALGDVEKKSTANQSEIYQALADRNRSRMRMGLYSFRKF